MSITLKIKAGDWFFDNNGRPKYITDEEKTAQDIGQVILSTPGLELSTSLFDVQNKIFNAISDLKAAQQNDPNLSEREEIAEIKEFFVIPNPDKPKTEGFFMLIVVTEAGDIVNKLFDSETLTDLSHILPDSLDNRL